MRNIALMRLIKLTGQKLGAEASTPKATAEMSRSQPPSGQNLTGQPTPVRSFDARLLRIRPTNTLKLWVGIRTMVRGDLQCIHVVCYSC